MEDDELKPLKRSQVLAVENAKRIAHQLRMERNDAVALAQVRREQAEQAARLCQRALDGADKDAISAELQRLIAEIRSDQ